MLEKLDTLPRIIFLSWFSSVFLLPQMLSCLLLPLYTTVSQFKNLFPAFSKRVFLLIKGTTWLCLEIYWSGWNPDHSPFFPGLPGVWVQSAEVCWICSKWICCTHSSVPVMVLWYFSLPGITTLLNVFHFSSNLSFFNKRYKTLIFLLHPTREKKHHLL